MVRLIGFAIPESGSLPKTDSRQGMVQDAAFRLYTESYRKRKRIQAEPKRAKPSAFLASEQGQSSPKQMAANGDLLSSPAPVRFYLYSKMGMFFTTPPSIAD